MSVQLTNASVPVPGCDTAFEGIKPQMARPFVKWVGGKTQLLKQLDENLYDGVKTGEITSYIEPFVGGGALFFYIAQNYPIRKFLLADNNTDLVLAYWTIRERVGTLLKVLFDLEQNYLRLPGKKREAFYYSIRKKFNQDKNCIDVSKFSDAWIEHTSHLIFLNKTGFNGLYRVNSAGMFNVAFGKYVNPTICDAENIVQVSHVLKRADIFLCDFHEMAQFMDAESFVYLDPPYRPLSETAYFTSYSPTNFSALDQQRLAQFCHLGNDMGAKILISNSDPSNVDPLDTFFEQNYPGFNIKTTSANRMINCRADRRGKINELMIMNY